MQLWQFILLKILAKYQKISFSERDKGDRFERLMQTYLKTDPKYAYLFKHVWLWNEFPGKLDLGGGDTGIYLVSLTALRGKIGYLFGRRMGAF